MNGLDVRKMSVWQFVATVEGWEAAHSTKQSAPSDEEMDALLLADAMRELGAA